MSAQTAAKPRLDRFLLVVASILLAGGLVMLTSASISVAERASGDPFFYLEKQLVAVAVGLVCLLVVIKIPTDIWERAGLLLAIVALSLLTAVLIPGFGHTVNGSTRWLNIGGVNLVQVSEPVRLLMLLYIADYAVRRRQELQENFQGFLKPMLLVLLTCGLLLAEPDFGAAVVMLVIALSVLFVAGGRLRHFLLLSAGMVAMLTMLAFSSSYRRTRITAFLDPWSDPFDSGFQLTQSLIAIGSGGWFGLGLGESVQKLFYLPEAHTDFVFAVIAEEFGLLGSILVIVLFGALIWRALRIAKESAMRERFFQAYVAFGFAIWQGFQALINIGVNMGILPTKGLTLPLISYGRSSLVVTLIGLGLLFRIDLENRNYRVKARSATR